VINNYYDEENKQDSDSNLSDIIENNSPNSLEDNDVGALGPSDSN
jgi:hypothetical protein